MQSILLFIKAPQIGKVKTRLAATIGDAKALKIYRKLVERQITSLPKETDLTVYFAPNDAAIEIANWLGNDFKLQPQCNGELGERLDSGISETFSKGSEKVICIGGDCPKLNNSHIQAAFSALDSVDVVFGPTDDGGYYLIGLNAPKTELFQNIPWSASNTLKASIAVTEALGLKHAMLETLYDIDDQSSLQRAFEEGLIAN